MEERKEQARRNVLGRGGFSSFEMMRRMWDSFVSQNGKRGKFKIIRWCYDENRHSDQFKNTVLKREGYFKRKYKINSIDEVSSLYGHNPPRFPQIGCSIESYNVRDIQSPVGPETFMDLVGVGYDFLKDLHDSGKETFEADYYFSPPNGIFLPM